MRRCIEERAVLFICPRSTLDLYIYTYGLQDISSALTFQAISFGKEELECHGPAYERQSFDYSKS